MNPKHCVIVEGIPGAGKTCLSKKLSEYLGDGTLYLTEPDDVGNANPYLADYYKDPAKWAFSMQIHLLQARYKFHKLAQYHVLSGTGHAVVDRSFYGDVGFAWVQKQLGYFSSNEYSTYESLFHVMSSNILYPSVCVVVDVTPEVAIKRIKKRMEERDGRKCEVTISTDYLKSVNDSVNTVAERLNQFGVRIINVDWNEDRYGEERDKEITSLALSILSGRSDVEFCDIYKRVAR